VFRKEEQFGKISADVDDVIKRCSKTGQVPEEKIRSTRFRKACVRFSIRQNPNSNANITAVSRPFLILSRYGSTKKKKSTRPRPNTKELIIVSLVNSVWKSDEIKGAINYAHDIETIAKKNRWHNLFESPKWILLNPADEVVDFYRKYIESPSRQLLARSSVTIKNIHDLGCGGGRHLYYFAELGFNVTGSDLSTNGTNYVAAELERRQLSARLVVCPMTELPFEDNEFDATISRAVINHATLQDMKKVIYEVARTTKPGGLFFVTFSSERASDWKKGTEVLKDVTYIPMHGPERGLVHTFLNAANTAALLEPFFLIEELYISEHPPLIVGAPEATDPNEYFGSEYVVIGRRR
jgi:SAM-dependent methyltransferase